MSLNKSTTIRRRLSLLAGSSLVAASLAAAVSFGAALAPTVAFAANECTPVGVDPSVNPGPDSYLCEDAVYPSGITYTSDGDLTVATAPPEDPDWGMAITWTGVEGVNLAGVGADSVTWDSTAGHVSGEAGPIIDLSSASGDISAIVAGVSDLTFSGTPTHGVRAISEGGGSVTVTAIGSVGVFEAGSIGIEAISRGGDGDVSISAGDNDLILQNLSIGGDFGIRGETSGSGALTIEFSNGSLQGSTAAIDATTGTGLLTINIEGGDFQQGNVSGGIVAQAGGDAVISVGAGGTLGPSFSTGWALDMTTVGLTTLNLAAGVEDEGFFRSTGGRIQEIRIAGSGSAAIVNGGEMVGIVDFSGLAGGVDIDILESGTWITPPNSFVALQVSRFSPGDDTLTSAGRILVGPGSSGQADFTRNTTIDFGAGVDAFTNNGLLKIHWSGRSNPGPGDIRREYAGETRLLNLETFTHSGVIMLGGRDDVFDQLGTDRWYDDVLSLPGTHWIGEGGEVHFDIDLNRTQEDCTTRNAAGDLGAADCIRLVGGSTEGTTLVTLFETIPGDRGRYDPEGIVLVDIAGGESHQGDFVISPSTPQYSPEFGGSLDKGVFHYIIAWDETDQQQKLVGLPGAAAGQFPLLASAGQSLWRTSTGTWFERQADQRGLFGDGIGSGFWLRASTEAVDRDVLQSVSALGQTFTFDNTLQQTSLAVTGGADLIVGGDADSTWVIGLMAGYATAEIEYEISPNQARFEGWTGGAYASYVSGGFFIDAAVNANKMDLEDTVPALELLPEGTILATPVLSWGVQLESGLRFPFEGGLFVEPLVGLSWVQSKYDEMEIPSDDVTRPRIGVDYDDPASFRGSVGGRVGWDQDYGAFRTQLSLLGKVVEEFDGENVVILHNPGPDAVLVDDFSGRFTEFGLGASIYSPGGTVSGFVNVGGQFGDDYDSRKGSIGVRVNW